MTLAEAKVRAYGMAAAAVRRRLSEGELCPKWEHDNTDERRVSAYMETIQRRLERQAETWRRNATVTIEEG